MTYGQVKKQVLKLLNQYSVAGQPVANSYNNQQDYINRIPGLVNDAMVEIATTARKILVTVPLSELPVEEREGEVLYELPSDFYQLVSGGTLLTREGKTFHTNLYSIRGRKYLAVPKKETGLYSVDYYRYPQLLPDNPSDSQELDNEPETHFAVAFYAAAYLVDHDDLSLCALFNNAYEDKLAKMGAGVSAEIRPVDDVYGFFG